MPPGIVLRTDYSTGSDDPWTALCNALHDDEPEFLADQAPNPTLGDGGDDNVAIPSGTGEKGSKDDDVSNTDD